MEKKRMLLLVVRTTGSYRRTTFFYSCWDYYCSCCLIVFDCRRCRSREPCVSPMTPCIKHYIVRHAIHCIQSPLNNVPPCGRCHCSCEYTLINHPLLPLSSDAVLKRLVNPDINWLTKGCAAAWDMFYFNTQVTSSHAAR